MYGFFNNTMHRVNVLAEQGGLSDTTVVLAVLAGVVIGLILAKLIIAGIARLMSVKKE